VNRPAVNRPAGDGPAGDGAAIARVAAIDCGTNSLRLLVADVDRQAARLADVDRRMEIVRLGQGVDSTGRLSEEALRRTLRALEGYARIIEETSASAVRMVATSAARDAANAADFVRGVSDVLGLEPEVLSGQEEAYLSFTGATAELSGQPGSPYLVVDIGGGSTEFVLGCGAPADGSSEGAPGDPGMPGGAGMPGGPGITAVSVNIGCVRMTERHLHGDPPTAAEIAAAAADIDAALVGLAGSVTTVAGLALRLPGYDAGLIHHSRIRAEEVSEQAGRLLRQTRSGRAALGVMHPGRVDVIGGGAFVLDRLMQRFGFAEVLVSEHDILDGIAWAMTGP
jgi:exopolyphosphatase/guanosine-5'-triphosphate,3'-diphosphate pyrophosphatase